MRNALLVLLAATLVTGCTRRAATPSPDAPGTPGTRSARGGAPAADLASVRAATDAVLRGQADAYWTLFTTGEPTDAAAAWRGHESILSDEALQRVGAAVAAAKGEERRARAYLRAWLVGERLAREVAGPARAVAEARSAATFEWRGRAVPLRDAPAVLASEPDPERRRLVAESAAAAARPVAPLVAAREAALRDAIGALGYPSPLALAAELRGEQPAVLAARAEATLARTEQVWQAILGDLAARDGLARGELRARDLPRLLRTVAPAGPFAGDRQLAAASELLRGLGIDLAAQPNLRVDAAARSGKLPQPIALPVDPPGDVRLSVTPTAGLEPLRALLHELGAAEYYAAIRADRVEFRRLGPAAIPQAWALLLEGAADGAAWLEARGLDAERASAEARGAAGRRLLRSREAAARVIAAAGPPASPEEEEARLARLLARARGVPQDPTDPPAEPDLLLRSAETLRAEIVAAQAELTLGRRAGGAWWRSAASGAWLGRAWAEGSRRSPEEIAAALGHRGLDPAAIEAVARANAGL